MTAEINTTPKALCGCFDFHFRFLPLFLADSGINDHIQNIQNGADGQEYENHQDTDLGTGRGL